MNEELTWAELVKAAAALGLITGNGSKADALKVHDMLKKQMEAGRVEQPARGRYRCTFVPGLLDEPETNDDG